MKYIDYYKVLEVSKSASEKEIKNIWRQSGVASKQQLVNLINQNFKK